MIKQLSKHERNLQRARQPGNSFLNKRTQKNARQIVCRLGYNTICNSYTPETEIGRLSGSTLNRQMAKKEKLGRQQRSREIEEQTPRVCKNSEEYGQRQELVQLLRAIKEAEATNKKRFSRPLAGGNLRVHLLSKRTKGKVRDKATALFRCFKTDGIMVTLTFIDKVEDRLAVGILNKFLTVLRTNHQVKNYLWVAERQMKNKKWPGNIHFHLVINQRLPVVAMNGLWLRQQLNAGLRHEKMTDLDCKNLWSFSDEELQERLNPLDIEPINSLYGLSYYLTKYIVKNQTKKDEGFACAAWHCSRSVSRLFTRTVVTQSTFSKAASDKNFRKDPKTKKIVRAQQRSGRFHNLFFIEDKYLFLPEMNELEQINCWILEGMLPDGIPKIDDIDISHFYNN